MPIIGQPAHTHFTPVITPVVLDRISLSVTYIYNVSVATYRVSLSRTYVYNLKIIVSLVQRYLYGLNLSQPAGPTRLYFHSALNTIPNLPDMRQYDGLREQKREGGGGQQNAGDI